MRRQRGQSAVEFALIVPLVCLLIFGGIYGGIMFIDYLNFSNEARTVARNIAVASDRKKAIAEYGDSEGSKTFARFYTVTVIPKIVNKENEVVEPNSEAGEDVLVVVNFNRDNMDLPLVVYLTGFPPENFRLSYRMKLEK